MEQQTISIAKAGITTVLNSRSSVLAAANPVFGRYDDLKSASENIDLMTTILSRFDLIFLVRDVREEERDRMICKHVMGVHISNSRGDGLSNSRNMRNRQLEEDDPLERYVCVHTVIVLYTFLCTNIHSFHLFHTIETWEDHRRPTRHKPLQKTLCESPLLELANWTFPP